MAKEYINGKLYINGYATDDAGRPRTISNGYTDEDEQDAIQQYIDAKKTACMSDIIEQAENNLKKNVKVQISVEDKEKLIQKYRFKMKLSRYGIPNDLRHKKTVKINGEDWEVEYINKHYYVGGYATNEMGQPICPETGYDNDAVKTSIQNYKNAKSTGRYFLF